MEKGGGRILLVLVLFAFLLRIPLLLFPEVIHNDGTEYIRHAKGVLSGNWAGGKAPPLYPFLVAVAEQITNNFEIAGIVISVLFGALLLVPVFHLGKMIWNEKVGILSALFVSVHPFLYTSSGSVLTESTYHFFFATSVLFGWLAFARLRYLDAFLFGLFAALAYLTRPEGIGILFVGGLWILLARLPQGSGWLKKTGLFTCAVLGFLAFSSFYLVQLRKETGRWELSKKVSISLGSFSKEEESPSVETVKKKKGLTLSSFVKNPLSAVEESVIGLGYSLYRFHQAFNPLLFFLALWGWGTLLRKKQFSLRANLYLLSFLFFFFSFVFPFFYVTRRYTSQMISISIPWAACGFLGICEGIQERMSERWRKRVLGGLLLLLLIGLFLQGRVIHPREHRVIQREAGLWMKDHLAKGAKVMSSLPQEAFYAEMLWIKIPQASYEEIITLARAKDVRYLILDEGIEVDSPGFVKKIRREDLIPLKEWKMNSRRLVLYEVIP